MIRTYILEFRLELMIRTYILEFRLELILEKLD